MGMDEYKNLMKDFDERQEKLQEKLEQIEREKKILDALCVDYTSVHYCELSKDKIITIKTGTADYVHMTEEYLRGEEKYKNLYSYSYRMQYYFDHYIVKESAPDFLEKFSAENLIRELADKKRMIYHFQALPNHSGQQHFEVQVVRVREEEGFNLVMGYRFIDDVVEARERQKRELEKALEEAKRANMAKTDFLRRMSHDLRTPINGIRGMLQVAEHCSDDLEKQRECREKMWNSSEYLLNLVNSVLDMNKLESGAITVQETPFNLKEIMRDLDNVLGTQAQEKGVHVKFGKHEVEHHHLIGSSLYVRQIFMNIGNNAVKYTEPGGEVLVSCEETRINENCSDFCFTVQDSGIGMGEEFQTRIYDAFSQEGEELFGENPGTGLGMSICKQLVDLLQGTIQFESEPGKGTTFVVHLPMKIDQKKQHEGIEKHREEKDIRGKKILLVEDNALNAEIAQFILERAGVQVEQASNGKEALDRFAASKRDEYQMILMDIMMPLMNGCEATRAIRKLEREDAKKIPIIAMSANAFQEDILECERAGMNLHLAKPINEKKLLTVVREYMN